MTASKRKSGNSADTFDAYYLDPSKNRYRSRAEVSKALSLGQHYEGSGHVAVPVDRHTAFQLAVLQAKNTKQLPCKVNGVTVGCFGSLVVPSKTKLVFGAAPSYPNKASDALSPTQHLYPDGFEAFRYEYSPKHEAVIRLVISIDNPTGMTPSFKIKWGTGVDGIEPEPSRLFLGEVSYEANSTSGGSTDAPPHRIIAPTPTDGQLDNQPPPTDNCPVLVKYQNEMWLNGVLTSVQVRASRGDAARVNPTPFVHIAPPSLFSHICRPRRGVIGRGRTGVWGLRARRTRW